MFKICLALAGFIFCLSPEQATAQCNGNFPAGSVCGTINGGAPGPVSLGVLPYTPERFAQPTDPDDTLSFTRMCAAISAAGVGAEAALKPGRVYNVFSTTPVNQSVACLISGVNGLRWYSNGATINIGYTVGPSISYFIELTNSTNIEINDLIGVAASGKHSSGDTIGVNWITCSNQGGVGFFGCRNLHVRRVNITGAINGIAITRAQGTGLWSWNITADGTFTNIGYPFSNQADGLNSSFDIVTNNAGRSYIGYNVWGVSGRINSTTGNELNDVEIAALGFGGAGDLSQNTTANIFIDYVNRNSTNYGASLLTLSHQQGDPVNADIASTISNVHFRLNVAFNGNPSTELFEANSFIGTQGSMSLGDPGNTENNITFSGKVSGSINSSFLGCLLTTSNGNCGGFNGATKGSFNLHDLEISSSNTSPWAIGTGAKVTFQNYASSGAVFPTFDGGYDFGLLTIRQPVVFGNSGSEPIQGRLNILDQSGGNTAINIHKGNAIQLFRSDDTLVGGLGTGPGFPTLSGGVGFGAGLGANSVLTWEVIPPNGHFVPNIDNTYTIGSSGLRPSNVFGVVGTFNSIVLPGSSSGNLTIQAAAAAGTNTITLPAGTTDFSATGGTSQVVKQTSVGGAFTVARLAAGDLSAINGGTVLGNPTTGSAAPTATASLQLGIAGATAGSLIICPGTGASCTTLSASNNTANWSFNLPTSLGATGTILASGGIGAATTWDNFSAHLTQGTGITLSGTTNVTVALTTPVSLANGGTNNSLTASNGGVVWSDASKLNILAGTATANLPLISGAAATPAWATIAYPTSATSGGVAYFSSTTAMASSGLMTLNGVMYGGGAGNPPLSTAQGAANTVLTANVGAPSFSAAPVIGTSVTTPSSFGGSAVGSTKTINGTSNGSPASAYLLLQTNGQFVGINNTTPKTYLDINANASSSPALINSTSMQRWQAADASNGGSEWINYGGATGNILAGITAGGTSASPTATATNRNMFVLQGWGYNGTTFQIGGNITIVTPGAGRGGATWSGTNQGTQIAFYTTPNNSTTSAEAVDILASGCLAVGSFTTDCGFGGIFANTFIQATTYLQSGTKLRAVGSAPALTSCGTSPSIEGSDLSGTVTMGTGSPTGCVITFNVAYTGAPRCTVSWRVNLASMQYSVSTSAITLTQTATSSNVVDYICTVRSGGWLLKRDLDPATNDNSPAFMDQVA
jgi:hypothetical protein